MNKARKKFILFSELAIILLLTVLLTVINVLSFTMAAEDADRVTEHLAMKHGSFEDANAPRDMQPPQDESSQLPNTSTGAPQSGTDNSGSTRRSIKPFRLNDGTVRMGPDSEEMKSSLRYFTAAIDKKGNVSNVSVPVVSTFRPDKKAILALINALPPFEPARLKGRPVDAWVNILVTAEPIAGGFLYTYPD